MKTYILTLLSILLGLTIEAQNINAVGSWRDHLSFNRLVDVCETNDGTIFAAAPAGIFAYDKDDGSITRYSKLNILNDVRISALEYDPINQLVIVGYENGNIDIISSDRESRNIPDLRVSIILGDKKIYDILPAGDRIYLATGLGIVVIDPLRYEVRETYIIGANGTQAPVTDVEINNGFIYAALPDGVLRASLANQVLANYANWSYVEGVPDVGNGVSEIDFINDRLCIVVKTENSDILWVRQTDNTWFNALQFNGLFIRDMNVNDNQILLAGNYTYLIMNDALQIILDKPIHAGKQVFTTNFIKASNGDYYITDEFLGLLRTNSAGNEVIIAPNGPRFGDGYRISAFNDEVWLAHGSVTGFFGNQFLIRPISFFKGERWSEVAEPAGVNSSPEVFDIINVAIDPTDTKHVFASSWEEGLIEMYDNQVVNVYNASNSSLRIGNLSSSDDWVGVSGLSFDLNGTLWMNNSLVTTVINSRDKEGNFRAYNFSPTVTNTDRITDIEAAQSGYIYSIVRGRGLLAFNPNGTLDVSSDDNFKLLDSNEGNGNLANNEVLAVKEDLDGELWIGTLQGLSVIYNQDAIFNSDQFDAEPILIEQGGNIQELLGTEAITAIEIDGGNRKWIATQTSGVFLFSADGQQEIHHFTVENSPLLSNSVQDIAINQRTGEVFFITDLGVISYFGSATNFNQEITEVKAYPNPVREDFTGDIVIDGLAYQTTVKITDLKGNIVFETESEGGRALWNGLNFNGERPATGIYLIFCSNPDGSAENVGKIAFIR